MILHLPTGPLKKPALSWSWYQDVNPVPSALLATVLIHSNVFVRLFMVVCYDHPI